MSEPKPITSVLNEVMTQATSVGKDQRNTEQGFDFRGIDDVINKVGPVFREHGVVPAPMLEHTSYRDVQTSRGKPARECTLQVRYRFWGPAGDYLDTVVPGESLDMGDKGTAKAMSVAYRIALLQLLALPTNDRDPDADSYNRAAPTVEQVRGDIAALAQEKGYPLDSVSSDFLSVMGGDIREANLPELAEYKQRFASYQARETL